MTEATPSANIISIRWAAISLTTFAAAVYLLNRAVLFVYRAAGIAGPPHWPLSVFNHPRGLHGIAEYAAAVLSAAAAFLGIRRLSKTGWRTGDAAALGLILLLLTTAMQGVPTGFVKPISGGGADGQQYWHDALAVHDPAEFLRSFSIIQPKLREHGRTHPPGAVLLSVGFQRAGIPAAAISVILAVVSTLITAWAWPRFSAALTCGVDPVPRGYGVLLLLLLPAVQVYYCSSLDAVVAALLLAATTLWLTPGRWSAATGTAAVALCAFLTFGFVWVLPVLLALDLRLARGWRRFVGLLAVLAVLGISAKLAFGFDYLSALLTASRLENPQGFRGLADPVAYLLTRLQDVCEIALFFGPFLIALAGMGFKTLIRKRSTALAGTLTAVGTLLLLFAAGAYRTGETARACLFVYPYLLLPVIAHLSRASERDRCVILALVFAQTLVMQAFGDYFW